MTSTVNRLTVLTLIITCLLLLFSSNIQCLEQTAKAVTSAPTSTSTIISPTPANLIRVLELDHHLRKEELEEEEDHGKRDGAPPSKEKDKDDDENDKTRYFRKYSKHVVKQGDYDGDKDGNNDDSNDNDKPHQTSSKPSDTIVTTIIIVATETPTPIYSGTTNNPAKQEGSSTSVDGQVNDTNSPLSGSNSSDSTSGSQENEPAETQMAQQLYKDQSAYRQLVLAMSIVGSIAGVALFVGGFLYGRMRMRRKQRKQADLEKAQSAAVSPSSPSPSASFPSLPPPVHHQSSSSSSLTPPSHNGRLSNMSEDGDATVIDFTQNPFSDPVESKLNNNSRQFQERVNLSPTAPPSVPTQSERYPSNYRQNHTLSMISQTTATALPSAPSAKELDAMTARYENPFEGEYDQPMNGHQRQHSDVSEEADNHEGTQEVNHHSHHYYLSPNIFSSSSSRHPERHMLSQTTQRSFSSSTTDLSPPPAYTPSAAPSAPPLYALPTTPSDHRQSLQPPAEQDLLMTTRRHSIDSIISLNNSRPISLRRGSGSNISYPSP